MKKKEVFRSKQDALSVWLQDQWSLISHLGKIAADPVVLEQQILQVQSLQSESRARKNKIGELSDLSQDASEFERKEVQTLKSRWNELETKLEERLISINEGQFSKNIFSPKKSNFTTKKIFFFEFFFLKIHLSIEMSKRDRD